MKKANSQELRILRLKDVMKKTGLAKSTIYHLVKQGTFPKPIKLGDRSSGWIEGEVDDTLNSRIEIRDMGNEVR